MEFSALINGAILGAALIIAIGAQNLFVLRQGMARDQVFIVCLLSSFIDGFLILVGALGLGSTIAAFPWLVPWAAWGGALFLVGFGLMSAWRAIWPKPLIAEADQKIVSSRKKAIMLTLAFGLLNPHVYLDTVVLLGSIAAGYEFAARIHFVIGAIAASFVWFFSVGYSARMLTPIMKNPAASRVLDTIVALMMFAVAANLLLGQVAAI
ncbi:LysE family transporter [Sneathiella marina]|uniref:LysE family transporter n=1 Tax=Sneathiella marina TaxID=2950108 RepID=A0ABY4W1Y8_9PROT|nr:LysE family transporter [Sneathiella marina]USG61190.1 LysE family transporter [Sneathiella marina]